jgi:hypothetical protein
MQGLQHAANRDAQRKRKRHDDYRYRAYKQALGYNPSHQGARRKKEFAARDRLAWQAARAFERSNKPILKDPKKSLRVGREFPQLTEAFDNLLVVSGGFVIPLSQLSARLVRGESERDERALSPFLPNILGEQSPFLPRLYHMFYGRDATVIRVASKNVMLRADGEAGKNSYRFSTILTDPSDTEHLLRPVDLQGPLRDFSHILWNSGNATSEIKKRSALSILLAEVGDDSGMQMQIHMQYPAQSNVFSAYDWDHFPAQTLDCVYGGKLSVAFLERPDAKLPSRSMIVPYIKNLLAPEGRK